MVLYIFIGLYILFDCYIFFALKSVLGLVRPWNYIVWGLYGLIALASWVGVYMLPRFYDSHHQNLTLGFFIIGLFISKLLVVLFLIIDDLRRGGAKIISLFQSPSAQPPEEIHGITRSQFLTRAGLVVGGSLFGLLAYGLSNKYNYKVRKVKLKFPQLPDAFDGLRIVQLSDIHAGSFDRPEKVRKGIETVMKQKPDLILFTGDLVNNLSEEMDNYWQMFSQLKAPMGVYATLGNHDYGDYVEWDSSEAKAANLQRLKDIEAKMGWKMLNNDHDVLEKEGAQIGLIGVENWSAKARFPKYGDMEKATDGLPELPFHILMSHDPSHWDAEIRPQYPQIDLSLAGHTHGMQFGVEIPGLKWSPIQYMYPEWAGLYQKGNQYLYVNRGFGFLGYPGRVGILPEITVLELKKG